MAEQQAAGRGGGQGGQGGHGMGRGGQGMQVRRARRLGVGSAWVGALTRHPSAGDAGDGARRDGRWDGDALALPPGAPVPATVGAAAHGNAAAVYGRCGARELRCGTVCLDLGFAPREAWPLYTRHSTPRMAAPRYLQSGHLLIAACAAINSADLIGPCPVRPARHRRVSTAYTWLVPASSASCVKMPWSPVQISWTTCDHPHARRGILKLLEIGGRSEDTALGKRLFGRHGSHCMVFSNKTGFVWKIPILVERTY
jgi:hypothetical protein